MKFKHILIVLASSFLSAFLAVYFIQPKVAKDTVSKEYPSVVSPSVPVQNTSYNNSVGSFDFTTAASIATPGVVHVKTSYNATAVSPQEFYGDDLFEWFFGQQQITPRKGGGSGSGVIISQDGYIATNNHVIDEADEIEVTLSNNTTYKASLVGRDKDTDIALLKIEATSLPAIKFANSDDAKIGEWVLAVGNPFNLASTVTAGIVSAKGRSINILEHVQGTSNTAIESFIQTDAAVNPGNSGGALVNLKGELIGINTAIATPTGTFAGYSFAVPSNIVGKVIADLQEYGAVQRGFIGVNIRSVDSEIANELGLESSKGVYLQNILEDGAADLAGLNEGDIIIEIDGEVINSAPELQEKIAEYRPGNVIELSYVRDQQTYSTKLTLKNIYNNLDIVEN